MVGAQSGDAETRFPLGKLRRFAFASIITAPLCSCDRGILNPVGPVGDAEKQILINSTAIMLAIIIPTMLATIAVAWWFRAGNRRAKYRPNWEYSGAVELVVWSIPALTIILLGGIAWIGSHDLDPYKPLTTKGPTVRVQVVSLDWKWLFIYPDQGIATVSELVVPAGVPVKFELTSATVWNAFFVPQLGSMIYTMPRMRTQLYLQANKVGTYEGQSSQFSGEGFSGMHFPVHALPPREFAAWVQNTRGKGLALDRNTYDQLAKPSSYVKPMTYGAVVPGLFNAIVAGRAPSRMLPQTTPPSMHVTPSPPLEGTNAG